MPFVQRESGIVVGLFANQQPGYAEEILSDDDPEVLGFLSARAGKSRPSLSFETFISRMTDEEFLIIQKTAPRWLELSRGGVDLNDKATISSLQAKISTVGVTVGRAMELFQP